MKKSYYKSKSHKGSQPVRVLYQNVYHWFHNTYPNFKNDELDEAIQRLGLNEEINIIEREEKVAMPAGVGTFKIITIQETFLSYLWCMSYSLMYIYDKSIHEPKINPNYDLTDELENRISAAHKLFNYGLSLLESYDTWNINELPNPEFYEVLEEEYVEKANGVYLNAVNFILLHELAHVALGHIDKDIENSEKKIVTSDADILKDEYDADSFAFERIIKGAENLTNQSTVAAGIIVGMCSFLFFSSSLKGGDHPDPDERLKIALEKLNLQPEDNLWGISCLAFKLWSIKHKINLDWPPIVETYQELFNSTIITLNKNK